VKLELRFPATVEKAEAHARLAVKLLAEERDMVADFGPASIEDVDAEIDEFVGRGLTSEEAAEALFVLGCYVGQVMVRNLGGRWVATAQSSLRGISPWPMVVVLPGGSTWDTIGKTYKRLELGDSEDLVSFFAAAATARRG
jgi:hypothetical protein